MYSRVKVEGPKGEQGTQGPQGEKGDSGGKGDKGDPMGILELPTEPPTKYEGMLWKHTGTVQGFIHNSIYRWTGSSWALFKFRAENIEATSLSAISADLGTVNAGTINGVNINGSKITQSFSNVVYDSQTGSKMTGQTSMHDYLLDCSYNVFNSSGTKMGSGEWRIHPLSFSIISRGSNGAISGQVDLSAAALTLKNSVKSISVTPDTYKDMDYGKIGLIATPGGGYTDTPITFNRRFPSTPLVFLTFNAGSQNVKYLGLAYFNETNTGVTIRITNSGTAQYSVYVNWLAML